MGSDSIDSVQIRNSRGLVMLFQCFSLRDQWCLSPFPPFKKALLRKFWLVGVLIFSGCATAPYEYGTGEYGGDNSGSPYMENQVIVGKPNKLLDASDWIWPGSWLAKLLLWNKNIDSHEISDETLTSVMTYIEKNDLSDVQVLVNAYRPGNQWSRLFKNKEIPAGWRFTLGILTTSLYTIMPGRFFGGDNYNPYTNTINLYSNDVAISLHEAAHAKDLNSRKYKGLNAALYVLPGAPLYYEAVATSDTLSYLERECRYDDQKHAYRVLHPAYGTYVGGLFLKQSGLGFLGVIPGHISGAIASLGVKNKEDNCPFSMGSDPLLSQLNKM